jgi:glutamyl-tRNA synthetase
VAFDDLVRGHVEIDTAALGGDLVIVRADGTPLYHFTVVVDDAAMGITHVIRGEDHLSNTPKHILLFRALGHPEPVFAHLPLILNSDRTKMSKRKSQTAVRDYIAEGFVREALVNYLAYLGWSPGTEEDVLALEEIVARFDLADVQKGGAIFDRVRLEWLNGQWIRRLSDDDLVDRLAPFLEADWAAGRIDRKPDHTEIAAVLPLVRERLPVLGAVGDLVGFIFSDAIDLDPALLVPKRWERGTARAGLAAASRAIGAAGPGGFTVESLELTLRGVAEANGWKAGDLFMAVRVALTGKTATTPLIESMVALGRERTLERLDRAARALEVESPA